MISRFLWHPKHKHLNHLLFMLHVHVLSPNASLFDAEATMVVLPGIEGDLSVLEQHTPFITLLRAESISIHTDTITSIDLPYGGLVHMDGHTCSVFVKVAPDACKN